MCVLRIHDKVIRAVLLLTCLQHFYCLLSSLWIDSRQFSYLQRKTSDWRCAIELVAEIADFETFNFLSHVVGWKLSWHKELCFGARWFVVISRIFYVQPFATASSSSLTTRRTSQMCQIRRSLHAVSGWDSSALKSSIEQHLKGRSCVNLYHHWMCFING